MSIIILSAFLRMLREYEEELTWRKILTRFCGLVVFVFVGMGLLKLMDLLIAACS